MNSTINKTFYTCFTESLFLKYNKVSKNAVEIGGFLQCSVHIFLGHYGASKKFLKFSGQYSPKRFLLKALSNY